MENPLAERKLSPSETILWLIDQECRLNFVMHARVTGAVPEGVLRRALRAVQARHPLLRVRIEQGAWNRVWFRAGGVPELPLRVVAGPGPGWIEEAEQELQEPLPAQQGPLARCTLVRHGVKDQTVLLAFHHAIGDAISGSFLMRDLFRAAALAAEGSPCELPALAPKRETNAYFPDWALGLRGRWRSLRFAGRMLGATLRHGRPAVPRFDEKAPPRKRRARIVPRRLDPAWIRRLHERAQAEGTTLHGALLAAQILAVARDRGDAGARLYLTGSPVNLRKRLNPPVEEDVGFFVTVGASLNLVEPETPFWPLAIAARRSLWNCVERGEPFVYGVQHRDLCRMNALLGRRAVARVAESWAFGGLTLSNIGRVPLEDLPGPFIIEDLGFAASLSCLSPLAAFAATTERRSTWNFVGMEPLLTKAHTEKIADSALKILSAAVD